MATTKILPVRKRLKDCLDYAANPKKTEIFRGDALDRLMHYTQNEDKTEHQLYVTGFNCDPQNACLIMEATKRRWHKDIGHGNVGYHIIQSFKPGEASPDQVHQIGCELARRCLADRFECTVSTHLDKGHLHNHIVVNSVSFMDGKMFRNDFKTYYQGIRKVSDDLCRQNQLSVIETDGRGISYGEWRNRREGKPTLRGMVKADVEMALAESSDFDDFVGKLAYALVFNTKKNPAASGGENEFWDKSAVMFLASLILYILYESPLYERNLNTMMDMILECKVSEDSYDENRMDILFGELEQRDPHHPAVLQYRSFKLGSAKTLSSIMVTAVSNLHMLQSAAFAEMIATDEMFLPKLGVEKRAIFCVIPDNDDTFNFMVSILYTQLFDQLFRLADSTPEFHGTLPVHVRLMMDEFANVATPENFVKILAVARSRNISCDIILQNISQIKSKYKDDWETIIGNCDSLVYLGGNDYSTFEYISKLLGKQTIRTKGQSIGKGSHGSSSDSYQVTGRELMTPDEVRRMKRSDCLVMISGEAPVRDKKYNLFDHPNLKYTPDYRSPRGLLHRAATPIPAPEGYTMPPDYMAQAGTVSLAYVAELTCPEITEDLYDELQEWEESLL